MADVYTLPAPRFAGAINGSAYRTNLTTKAVEGLGAMGQYYELVFDSASGVARLSDTIGYGIGVLAASNPAGSWTGAVLLGGGNYSVAVTRRPDGSMGTALTIGDAAYTYTYSGDLGLAIQ